MACVLLSMGCYSFYFASYYTESLCLSAVHQPLISLYQRNYLPMGVFGFFLTLTEHGIVLLLGLLVQVIADYCKLHGKKEYSRFFRFAFTDWKLLLGAVYGHGVCNFNSFFVDAYGRSARVFIQHAAAWAAGLAIRSLRS